MKTIVTTWQDHVLAGLPIRPVTRSLVTALFWDLPVDLLCQADFGIESQDHYRALRTLLLEGADAATEEEDGERGAAELRKRIGELDAAWGKGPAITALVKRAVPQYGHVHFQTVWDALDLPTTAAG